MSYDPNQFSSLINTIGSACNDKDLDLVTDALSVSIANVGVSYNIPYDDFLHRVLKVITSVYVVNDINSEIDDDKIH